MAITGWTEENSGSPAITRDVGGSDNGVAGAAVNNNSTDNNTYYTFNGTDSYLRWDSSISSTGSRDYKIRFRLHNKNKNAAQVMWKSGGNTNGVALGLNSTNRLGLYTRNDSIRYDITFDNTQFEENVWYILYASETRVSLWNESTETFVEVFGSIEIGTGSADEAMGAGAHSLAGSSTSVISSDTDPTAFFDGDVDFVAIYNQGNLDFPREHLEGWSGENSSLHIESRDMGSNDQGDCGGVAQANLTDNGDYYTFNGINSKISWDTNYDESAYHYKAKFRIPDKNRNTTQVIWKAGGGTNGFCIGIDSSNNLGIFSRTEEVGDSNTFTNTKYDENVWYILYASPDKIALYNTETSHTTVSEKTISFGNDGSTRESMGAADSTHAANTTVIDPNNPPNDPTGYFEGDVDFVAWYTPGELDFPEASAGGDINGVGGNYEITANINQDSRLIIMNDTDSTIEWSNTVTSGITEATGLTETTKIIVAREIISGESYGYGGVTPILSGPVYLEDFKSGIDDWSTYKANSGGSVTWVNGDSMRMRAQYGASTEAHSTWQTGISGDYDVEIDFTNVNNTGNKRQFMMFMKTDNEAEDINYNYISIQSRTDKGGLYHAFRQHNTWYQDFTNGDYVWTGKFRFTRVGDDYKTYYDSGSGWVIGQETTYAGWNTMYLMICADGYALNFLADINYVSVWDGTLS